MPTKDLTQAPLAPAQPTQGTTRVQNRLRDLLGARGDAEVYLSTEQGAELIGSPSREAFIKYCRRHQIPLRRAPGSRTLLVKKADIDWALRVR